MRIWLRSVVVFCSFYLATEHVQGGLIYAQYDDFNDNSIDSGKWNVLGGEVTESDGRLNVWMNRNGHFFDTDHSMITSEGKVGGEDIFGFRLNSDRIPARRAGPGDAEAALGITDGTNSITINWLNDVNQFILRATGVYGSGDIYRWDPDAPGPAEQPDGPLEIRDNGDNSITVLHNNSPEYTFGGISIQSNSYFFSTAYTNPNGGENGVPVDFDYRITIDDLDFLYSQSDVEPASTVPEPSSWLLMVVGLLALSVIVKTRVSAT